MKLVSLEVTVASEDGHLDPKRIRSAQRLVRNLVSSGESVLIKINPGQTGKTHLEYAKKYSSNLRDVKKEIRKTNGQLMIAALSSVKVPTHNRIFDNKRDAIAFLKKGIPKVAVF